MLVVLLGRVLAVLEVYLSHSTHQLHQNPNKNLSDLRFVCDVLTPMYCPLMKTCGTLILSFSRSFSSARYSGLIRMSLSSTLTLWFLSICTIRLHSSNRPRTAWKLVVYTTTWPSSFNLCDNKPLVYQHWLFIRCLPPARDR